jgi:probable rRNA maturation factor
MSCRFTDSSGKSRLLHKRPLAAFITNLVGKKMKRTCSLQYVFVSDEELLGMNQNFLQHNTYTDIITFDLSADARKVEGEIYISVDRVKANAEKFAVSYTNELHRVIFHGALHLCGYKDKTKKDKEIMRSQEDLCLKQYGV